MERQNFEANKTYWDAASSTLYKSLIVLPGFKEMYAAVTKAILSRSTSDPGKTTLLDFACGNGDLSVPLAPHFKTIVGVDISQKTVDNYNKRMKELGIDKARAFQAELGPNDPKLAGQKFDVILCANSYKHILDNVAITRVLKSYLKPNGVLLVVEAIQGKESFQSLEGVEAAMGEAMKSLPPLSTELMPHRSYSEGDIRKVFDAAGLVDFQFEEIFVKEGSGGSFGLFLAEGVNPN